MIFFLCIFIRNLIWLSYKLPWLYTLFFFFGFYRFVFFLIFFQILLSLCSFFFCRGILAISLFLTHFYLCFFITFLFFIPFISTHSFVSVFFLLLCCPFVSLIFPFFPFLSFFPFILFLLPIFFYSFFFLSFFFFVNIR